MTATTTVPTVTKLENFVQTLRQAATSDLVKYLVMGHDMHRRSIVELVVDDAYTSYNMIRNLSPAEENDVQAALRAVAAELDRRIPAAEPQA